MKSFTLSDYPYIQLNQLLKLLNLAETGGEANLMITEGKVKVNGTVELQKRKKLYPGDKVDFNGEIIVIAPE
ncbi:RNA-binding S4 domain-containing protein [Lentimicrobium sp.]|jgi:ribosome-associated protein|uniref:RNA-binding S4 domain-containing protein n=1 Tax=Lentimicrobium sp. TaxID=2034841 RepID=UPI0025FF3E29|nr:RNA-binding S4 domain-containing protein [Lentimicrobium sp.]MCO5257878.1 RNA-binding S4 domain-containing protein [Lentimicrobium sp.]MCO5263227.1 RNA-binding S4 domain-containing protein [Lentimicrobium sp.]HOP14153.1 RNA-binding S4 domain-containing protein [Lentimicrobium sp.]HPF64093.1 RNA-binding S4 domain-containing protein [Lentimicrobium sp.]HPJ62843.1 RNA-binding S4 domain-containing protein [Lentimicrobium sp.]